MKRVLGVAFTAVALVGAPVAAQQARSAQSPPAARGAREEARREIEPRADQTLRRMSDYLASLPAFRVDAMTVDEVVTQQGEKIQQVSESRVSLRRPNQVRAERVGPVADVVFRYDGQNFSLYGNRTGYYAMAPAPPTLEQAVDVLRDRFGLDIPGADLLSQNPYQTMMSNAREGRYVGLEPIAGVPTHHLAFRGDEVDWQIWIQDGPEPVPRRFVITSKTEAGQPEFAVDLGNWDTHARFTDRDFAFQPPRGATRVELLPAQPTNSNERQR